MKIVHVNQIAEKIENLCMEANYYLNEDILTGLHKGLALEESETGKDVLSKLIENAEIAKSDQVAICQDTGMTVVFIEIGQEVYIDGGSLKEAIHEGVRRGYQKGYLRKSVVSDPIERNNTGDNTPAVIHFDIVEYELPDVNRAKQVIEESNNNNLTMPRKGNDVRPENAIIYDYIFSGKNTDILKIGF